jgi:hypothetical protein
VSTLELDALQFEEEEEGTSYLTDLNKVPDFVDEAPIETEDVSLGVHHLSFGVDMSVCRHQPRRPSVHQPEQPFHTAL